MADSKVTIPELQLKAKAKGKPMGYNDKYYGTPDLASQTRKQQKVDPSYPHDDWQQPAGVSQDDVLRPIMGAE